MKNSNEVALVEFTKGSDQMEALSDNKNMLSDEVDVIKKNFLQGYSVIKQGIVKDCDVYITAHNANNICFQEIYVIKPDIRVILEIREKQKFGFFIETTVKVSAYHRSPFEGISYKGIFVFGNDIVAHGLKVLKSNNEEKFKFFQKYLFGGTKNFRRLIEKERQRAEKERKKKEEIAAEKGILEAIKDF